MKIVPALHRALSILVLGATLSGGPSAAVEPIDFERHIVPILARRCVDCHNPSELPGDLDLTTHLGAMKGGESGSTVVPGEPDESYLVEMISSGQMPPEAAPKLTPEEVGHITTWIRDGAKWPEKRAISQYEFSTDKRAGRDWWSLQPVKKPQVPQIERAEWVRNAIDAFVLQKLEQAGLEPGEEADPRTLLRRAMLDLHGLPPSVADITEFTASDSAPYERLVERLLTSPRYGERWGRHWLDVVRFAETNGFETNTPRPAAWPYRDYIIESFNDDKPYDKFVIEQLAGDAHGVDEATGFLVGGAFDTVKSPDVALTLMQRQDELADMVNTTGTTFLAMTTGCARCHDHKFDPIPQRDYYALQAVFAGVQHGERPLRGDRFASHRARLAELKHQVAARQAELAALGVKPPVNARHNIESFAPIEAKFVRFTITATNNLEPCLDELEIFAASPEGTNDNLALAASGAKATSSGNYPESAKHKLAHINDGRYGNDWSWISSDHGRGWVQIELPAPAPISRIEWGRDRKEEYTDRLAVGYRIEVATEPDAWQLVASNESRLPALADVDTDLSAMAGLSDDQRQQACQGLSALKELQTQLRGLEASVAGQVYAGVFTQPEVTHRLHRGEPNQRREVIAPGALSLVQPLQLSIDAPEQERRMALARWIANPNNPLTARVMVNRIWHYHFGQGIVSTPSDFGANGARPSHPELLDWLAAEFVESGWSIKHIHRLIMQSSTYRQSSRLYELGLATDADNRLLWQFRPRRLEAEAIRDSVLAVSGGLDLQMGGPGFSVYVPNDNYVRVYEPLTNFGPAHFRRMVYMTKVRMEQDSTFGAFDTPDAGQVCPKRAISTTSLQALNLLNSPFIMQQAEIFAERLKRDAGDDAAAQVQHAFLLTMARAPDTEEQRWSMSLIKQHGAQAFCRAMLNANEFLFLP